MSNKKLFLIKFKPVWRKFETYGKIFFLQISVLCKKNYRFKKKEKEKILIKIENESTINIKYWIWKRKKILNFSSVKNPLPKIIFWKIKLRFENFFLNIKEKFRKLKKIKNLMFEINELKYWILKRRNFQFFSIHFNNRILFKVQKQWISRGKKILLNI